MFKNFKCKLPMNLQFFAEADGGNGGGGNLQDQNSQQPQQSAQQSAVQIDYAKIQQMLDGTLAAKEDTALKAYFKQQGLSQEDAEQAMSTFKTEKVKNQPDVNDMQSQLSKAQLAAQKAMVENAATIASVGLGIEVKTIPYILKMADLSQVMGEDGKISDEILKNALNKVLDDVPALKPQPEKAKGFVQVGTGDSGQQPATDNALKKAFGI